MVDFHPGYSIGAVTLPLHSLNQQLKMIAKQLGTLSELHGALATQVSIWEDRRARSLANPFSTDLGVDDAARKHCRDAETARGNARK